MEAPEGPQEAIIFAGLCAN